MLNVLDEIAENSDCARPSCGRFRKLGLSCCACTAAAACLTSDELDNDFCNMTSDILRFFSMGFLFRKELFLDKLLAGSVAGSDTLYFLAVCSGP